MENMESHSSSPVQKEVVYVQQERRKSPMGTLLTIILGIAMICSLCGILPFSLLLLGSIPSDTASSPSNYTHVLGDEKSSNNILALYIDQPILTSSQSDTDDVLTSLLVGQYVFGYRVKDQLVKAATDDSIKAVLLVVNSPGGTIVGSRAIADGVAHFQEKTGKPVYAYIEDIAASGGYWAAISAEKVYAEQGSLVGSIGVIMGPFEYYDKIVTINGIGTQNGVSFTYITGGTYKDLGNPVRPLSEDELTVLQNSVDDEYEVFVEYVSKQRNIPKTYVKDTVKALIYGAPKAKEYQLIDEIATRDETITALAQAAKLGEDYQVVKIGSSTSLFGSLFASYRQSVIPKSEAPARVCVLCGKPLYFYGNPLDY
ncbi:MAG: signal peptide peptidase SppA [Candidatus Dojkabacteria bacterium]|nr:MAG: signal peptide peptidase SppA [Candidatus Dojkabacteria bacterium]